MRIDPTKMWGVSITDLSASSENLLSIPEKHLYWFHRGYYLILTPRGIPAQLLSTQLWPTIASRIFLDILRGQVNRNPMSVKVIYLWRVESHQTQQFHHEWACPRISQENPRIRLPQQEPYAVRLNTVGNEGEPATGRFPVIAGGGR